LHRSAHSYSIVGAQRAAPNDDGYPNQGRSTLRPYKNHPEHLNFTELRFDTITLASRFPAVAKSKIRLLWYGMKRMKDSLSMTQVLQAADRNPVVQAEFHYQRFVIARGRVGGVWIFLAALLILPSLLMSLAFIGLALFALAQRLVAPCVIAASICQTGPVLAEKSALELIPFVDQSNVFLLCLALLLTMMIAMSLVVTMINMALAANSIRREKDGNTWDALRLTDIGPQRIVLGKWWASLRALNGDYVMTCLLRMGFVTFYLASAGPTLQAYRLAQDGLTNGIVLSRSTEGLTPLPLLLILTVIYSVLDAALTAALGVFSALPNDAAGSVAGSAAFLMRLATLVGAAAWMYASLEMAASAGVVMGLVGMGVYGLLIAGVLVAARWSVG